MISACCLLDDSKEKKEKRKTKEDRRKDHLIIAMINSGYVVTLAQCHIQSLHTRDHNPCDSSTSRILFQFLKAYEP